MILYDLKKWAITRLFTVLTVRLNGELIIAPIYRWAARKGVTFKPFTVRTL